MNITKKRECGPTKQQIKIIHILASKLNLAEDTYRLGLIKAFGVSSSKHLTYSQSELLIEAFQREAAARGVWSISQKKFEQPGQLRSMATPSQLSFINDLWMDVSWGTDDESRNHGLRTFLAKTVKVSDKRFLTKANASKVIEILKQMKVREMKGAKVNGQAWGTNNAFLSYK